MRNEKWDERAPHPPSPIPRPRFRPMPFGAEYRSRDETRFRLWAPSARAAALCLDGREQGMAPAGDGWFEAVAPAAPGSRYMFRIDGGLRVPDPASRFNPEGVHGPSEVVDPAAFDWTTDEDWRGRPWEEAVVYELHVGCFSPQGTFAGVARRLDHLVELGVTAIELMPVASCAGRRNWGYDGVLLFAPAAAYGRPEELKALVRAAHAHGLMVLLDVVYNHFGPDGNYLSAYAKRFFDPGRHTPWGPAIAFDGADSRAVRDFYVANALYWLEEFRFDGLRFDAVHAIRDDSATHILAEIAAAVRAGPGRERAVHLVLENDCNAARFLRAGGGYAAQWNDDVHHALHRLITGEADGYYVDYGPNPVRHLGRCLAEGFAYQGERSPYRDGARRGEPSGDLPPSRFVSFLQNHDQVGNRAYGERIGALAPPAPLRAAVALTLLAPSPPLLFMGEEFAAATPFLYFCDFDAALADAVKRGRRSEFARRFAVPRESVPDPNGDETFLRSRLDWHSVDVEPHRGWLAFYRELLALRRREIAPRLAGMTEGASVDFHGEHALTARWRLGDGAVLILVANLGPDATRIASPPGVLLHATPARAPRTADAAPWSVAWYLSAPEQPR
jgi:maltooligosyltrehalose trehalohydrolase